MCVYVILCVYMRTCVYMYTMCVCVYTHICTHTHMHPHTYAPTHMHPHTYAHKIMSLYIIFNIYVLCIYVLYIYIYYHDPPPGVAAWECFQSTTPEKFPSFFRSFLTLKQDLGRPLQPHEQVTYLLFTINIFQSLESELVRKCVLGVVSLPLWHCLSEGHRQVELHTQPQLAKRWGKLMKKEAKVCCFGGGCVGWQWWWCACMFVLLDTHTHM